MANKSEIHPMPPDPNALGQQKTLQPLQVPPYPPPTAFDAGPAYPPGVPPPVYSPSNTAPQSLPPSNQYQHFVVVQPGVPQIAPTPYIKDNMGLAIFATLCCFWPLGIVAIIKSYEVQNALARNDVTAAQTSANQSRRFSFISIVIGILLMIASVIVIIVVVVTGPEHYYGARCFYDWNQKKYRCV